MTYLVSETDHTDLLRRLASIAEMVDIEERSLTVLSVINGLRGEIALWVKLRPMVDEMGHETEIINSRVVAECAVHGLFYLDDKRGPKGGFGTSAVQDRDCPACEREENAKWEAVRDAKTDARVEEARDRQAGIQI